MPNLSKTNLRALAIERFHSRIYRITRQTVNILNTPVCHDLNHFISCINFSHKLSSHPIFLKYNFTLPRRNYKLKGYAQYSASEKQPLSSLIINILFIFCAVYQSNVTITSRQVRLLLISNCLPKL